MKRRTGQTPEWVVDYSAARAHAIKWLGDRYLLANPINVSRNSWRKLPPAILQATLQATPGELVTVVPPRVQH